MKVKHDISRTLPEYNFIIIGKGTEVDTLETLIISKAKELARKVIKELKK